MRFISKNFIIGLVFQVTFFAVVAALIQSGLLKGGETLAAGFMIISLLLVVLCGQTAYPTNQQKDRHETERLTKSGLLVKCGILIVFAMFSIWAG